MKDYYVYIYTNPTVDYDLDLGFYHIKNRVFYIGKGCGKRKEQSLKDVFSNKSNNFQMIQETIDIRMQLKEPVIDVIMDNLNEKQAFLLEAYLIDYLGLDNLSNRINGVHLSLLEDCDDILELLELFDEL